MTRCKFKCESVLNTVDGATIKLSPVTSGSEENKKFFKYTPFGEFNFGTVNSEVATQFIPGKEYYIDISLA